MGINFADLMKAQTEQAKSGDLYKGEQKGGYQVDERLWKIGKDDKGNGTAVIRLLPSFNSDQTALNQYVVQPIHSINGEKLIGEKVDKRWTGTFICPRVEDTKETKHKCPACDFFFSEYARLKEEGLDKDEIRKKIGDYSARDTLYTNALIVNDPIKPENNGKVFLIELKRSFLELYDKENERIRDLYETYQHLKDSDPAQYEQILTQNGIPSNVESMDAFNLMSSKNLVLKYTNKKDSKWKDVKSYWGYSTLEYAFSPIVDDMAKAEELVRSAYNLEEFTKPSTFEGAKTVPLSEEKIQEKLDYVMFKQKRQDNSANSPEESKPKVTAPTVSDEAIANQMEEHKHTLDTTNKETTSPDDFMNSLLNKEEPKQEVKEETKPSESQSAEDLLAELGIS